jgi:hypothetical protein
MTVVQATNSGFRFENFRVLKNLIKNTWMSRGNLLANTHPQLRVEFLYALDKNGNRDDTVTFNTINTASHKKVVWKCPKTNCEKKCEHIYVATPHARTNKRPSGCAVCKGDKVCPCNSLAQKYPKVLEFWDYELNTISPKTVPPHSNRKVWWKCPKTDCKNNCKHVYFSIVSNKTREKPTGCPCCDGKQICFCKSLMYLRPDLMAEWDYERNNGINPLKISLGSHIEVWWRCLYADCDCHVWKTAVCNRVIGTNCSFCCSNPKFVCEHKNAATAYPELLKEWDDEKNNGKKLSDFSYASGYCGWWKCIECNHSWQSTIDKRTIAGNNCPRCCTSKMEKAMNIALENLKIRGCIKSFVWDWPIPSTRFRADFYTILDINGQQTQIIIETDGQQHFVPICFGSSQRNPEEHFKIIQRRDNEKKEWCRQNNVHLLRLSYLVPFSDYETEVLNFFEFTKFVTGNSEPLFKIVKPPVI